MKNNKVNDLLVRRVVSRELFMKFLYQNELLEAGWEDLYQKLDTFLDGVEDDAMEIHIENGGRELDQLETYRDVVLDGSYLIDMSRAIESNISEIDEYINKYARNWTVETLPKVDVSILRIAIAEIKYTAIVPNGVACDQAVILAKKYCDDNAYKYINGILGSVIGE
ncbi:transcription antitermination factor NusB [Peptostreptococcus russellii]|uniref:transcription antitermination factor NusB n=1 Tax=Peptostreptococcus russellii TaxID=215200 RepID=UPI001626A87A|nr:transcription antitermination factor NusB [Peptostreptococcus russellii]MBC2577229.1 transcription antitermination factor NusB [Peptostreptococcus russellii]